MEKTKLLTISFLCPGKTEDVFKTLESIQPILKKVDSELIIVDTGCSKEFRERLLKYTDQIIPFNWTGDFAEARNVGVDNAHGKWFMTIDDDEWFINTDEIVDFFAKGQYKQFTAALYTVRNFIDYEEKNYTDSPALRIFNIEGEQRWVGKIHEYITIYENPSIAALGSVAKHFGYIYSSEEERMNKSRRNIKPLLEMREEDPDNIYWVYQLVQEYFGIEEYEKAKDLAETGIVMLRDGNSTRDNNVRNTMYYTVIYYYITQHDIKSAFEKYLEITSDKRITEFGKAAFAIWGAEFYFGDKNYEKALECCKTYNSIYNKRHNDSLFLAKENCLLMGSTFSEGACAQMQLKTLRAALMINDIRTAKEAFKNTDWNHARENDSVIQFVVDFVSVMGTTEYNPLYSEIIDELVESEAITYGLQGNITHFTAGNPVRIKAVADCFMNCKKGCAIIHREQVIATSEQMRTMANSVLTQIVSLRQNGQGAEADSIQGQLNSILEKMPVSF